MNRQSTVLPGVRQVLAELAARRQHEVEALRARARASIAQLTAPFGASQKAKRFVGGLSASAALAPGMAVGAWRNAMETGRAAQAVGKAATKAGLLMAPSAGEARRQAMADLGNLAGTVREVMHDPGTVADVVKAGRQRLNEKLNPFAAPMAPSVVDEIGRNLRIGLNHGELGFDMASLVYGSSQLGRLGTAHQLTDAERMGYFAARFRPELAARFAMPYPAKGRGHHLIQNPLLEKAPWIPPAVREWPIFINHPRDSTFGDFSKLHYMVDNSSRGGRLPRNLGGETWSGEKLGWKKYDPARQLFYGSSPTLKGVGGGLLGWPLPVAHQAWLGEDPQ